MNDVQKHLFIIHKCRTCKYHTEGILKWTSTDLFVSNRDGCSKEVPLFINYAFDHYSPPLSQCKERNYYERK